MYLASPKHSIIIFTKFSSPFKPKLQKQNERNIAFLLKIRFINSGLLFSRRYIFSASTLVLHFKTNRALSSSPYASSVVHVNENVDVNILKILTALTKA